MISTELWPKISSLVDQALQLPEEKRSEFLNDACQGDQRLMRESAALLDIDTGTLDRVSRPIVRINEVPDTIGPYRILETIGSGGMSRVYLGVDPNQDDPRPVAVKLLDQSNSSLDLERRFQREGQILQRFRHPHIAALFGTGRHVDGRPYLVMEHVDGKPVDQFCRERNLGLAETLRLFQKICRAVTYAHRNLVVHRDLKPSNILVTESGDPKLLDFGISKLLDADSQMAHTVTRTGWQAMTPQYASPEQILGLPATTACDVYGLGVILYQLLTGSRPFDATGPQLLEQVKHQPAEPPSRAAELNTRHAGSLRGDLDTIALKALSKEPRERYGSAEQLDEDIERYLTDLPILARAPSRLYQLGKWVRRQRRLVSVLAMALVTLTALGIDREWHRRELIRQRDKALAVQDFFIDVFSFVDPLKGNDGSRTVGDMLNMAEERVSELTDQPTVQADFLQVLGQVNMNLGDLETARPQLRKAIDLHVEHRGEDTLETAATRDLMGQLLRFQGDLEKAAEQLEAALRFRRDQNPPDNDALAAVINNLALVYKDSGRLEQAEALAQENLTLRTTVWGADHVELAVGLNTMAYVLLGPKGKHTKETTDLFTRSLDLRRLHLPPEHPDIAVSLNNLGTAHMHFGEHSEAAGYFREALDIWSRILGDSHSDVLVGSFNLAVALHRSGETEEALDLMRSTRARSLDAFGPEFMLIEAADRQIQTMENALTSDP